MRVSRVFEVDEVDDCAFFENSFCAVDGSRCAKLCGKSQRRRADWALKDYLELHWSREESRFNRLVAYVATGTSLVALVVSLLSYSASVAKSEKVEVSAKPQTSVPSEPKQ